MQDFLIFYAPPIVVAASILFLFWWGAKGNFLKDIN
ncbi:cytochrome bd oxidase small subunit CydS [Bacillus sp. Marseille-P3661]